MTTTISTVISPEEKQQKREDYERMLTEYYRINPDTYNPIDESIPDNVPTKQFKATTTMYELLARLKDAGHLLASQLEILNDDTMSKTKHKEAVRVIEKYVLPILPITQTILKNGADKLAPKGGGIKAQMRDDVEMKRNLMESKQYASDKSEVSSLLVNYLETMGALKRKRKILVETDRVTRKKVREVIEVEETTQLPIPKNGKEYGVGESSATIDQSNHQ
jgi:acyl-homoserine lactone acylase PvdQ